MPRRELIRFRAAFFYPLPDSMTARQRVLTYLTKNRTASAREIARGLKMSVPAVRHHLRVLTAEGRLEAEGGQKREGRGRRERLYSLPRAALGDNLSALAEALLDEAGSSVRVEALAKRLAGEVSFAGQPVARRLTLLIEKLNQMHYHARWEAGAEGPRVLFGHCPYAPLVGGHPELCEMDANLLALLASRPVLREARPETPKHACPFVFLMR
ncbi:MAG: winged helix-turn-helix transcriptional regulator [Chloroflexota bacterium]|jgi:predicted ArsR family transcriptional regulator